MWLWEPQHKGGRKNKNKIAKHTCQVFGQVRVVHEAVTRKLYTLEPDGDVNVVEPGEKKVTVIHSKVKTTSVSNNIFGIIHNRFHAT